jgi:hypothetical protein
MRLRFLCVLAALFAAVLAAQTVLTNDAIIRMAKAGLGEEIILGAIKSHPGKYTARPDDLIALKQAGVSDKAIAAMMEKTAADGSPAAPAAPLPPSSPVYEVGVYYGKAGAWVDLPPEVVNFKTGGVFKSIATAGLVKGDINGRIDRPHSPTALASPVVLLVYAPEGVAITEYQLLRLREQKDAREFRTVTGGVLHVSGGATRDALPFESKKVAPRTYEISLPNLGSGEYGLLPPSSADATASSGRIGKIYSFQVIE